MTWHALAWLALLAGCLAVLAKPLGTYLARVYEGKRLGALDRILGPVERATYRLCGINPQAEMVWSSYAWALLIFSGFGILALFLIQRLQGHLPLNPLGTPGVAPDLAFNTAISFSTNTNWQSYGGETTMSHLTQMSGLGVQNFVSAASGMAVLAALVRGLARREARTIGNFWVDLVRGTLYVLLPLALILAVALASQGVVQSLGPGTVAALVEPVAGPNGTTVTTQTLVVGPVASQVAIKQLGTNGGGFFNANSSHPFENPTTASNFLQTLAILLLPVALCYAFGRMVGQTRQGWALLAVMILLFLPAFLFTLTYEQRGNPAFTGLGVDQAATSLQPGGNMEGKETRFGIASSALWASATTATSSGSVNCMHDSLTPLGGLGPMWLMLVGEVVFGGVGSGLYGMVVFAIIAVFIAGLMVGRTPEYLGKKIGTFEIKMASLVILIPPSLVLLGTAAAVATRSGLSAVSNPGPHGFSEVLYSFASASNNNGSAFAGLASDSGFYNLALGLCMFFGRYWLMIPALAIAGSLAQKRPVPEGPGTLATHTPLFVVFLACVVVVVGALTFLPALALGPIVEHLMMVR